MCGTGNGLGTSDAPMELCWRLNYGAGPAGIALDNHLIWSTPPVVKM